MQVKVSVSILSEANRNYNINLSNAKTFVFDDYNELTKTELKEISDMAYTIAHFLSSQYIDEVKDEINQ